MTRHDKLLNEVERRERVADLIHKARFMFPAPAEPKKRRQRGSKKYPAWVLRVYFGEPGVTIGNACLDRVDAQGRTLRRRCVHVTVPPFWLETVAAAGLQHLDGILPLTAERHSPPPEGAEEAWTVQGVRLRDDVPNGRVEVWSYGVVRYGGKLYASMKGGSVQEAMNLAIDQTLIALGIKDGMPF